jgi:hypothetical protein
MRLQCYFELSATLETERFNKLLKKRKYQLYPDNDNRYVDCTIAPKGITVSFHDNPHKKKVKLTVSWNKSLSEEDTEDDKISKKLRKLETRIDDYFNSKFELNGFKLSGMGIVADIDVDNREKAAAYMKVLKKIGYVKGFSPSEDSRFDNGGFNLKGNSNGIEFTIRDLEDTKGILRAEVRLTAHKAIRHFTDETVASEQIADLSKNSVEIFLKTFMRIIPAGDFHKKNNAVEIIKREVTDRTLRWKMLRLITLIPEKKSLLLAQKALNYRHIDDVMYEFFSINLSPVTLSKRHEVKYLKSLYEYF